MIKAITLILIYLLTPTTGFARDQTDWQKIMLRFKARAEKHGVQVPYSLLGLIKFDVQELPRSKYEGSVLGTCDRTTQTITIEKRLWNEPDEWDLEQVAFHELAHCILNREHVTRKSMMSAIAIERSEYLLNREEYLRELFTGK